MYYWMAWHTKYLKYSEYRLLGHGKNLLKGIMRSIIIIIYVISIPALKNNNLEDYIGELEKIV